MNDGAFEHSAPTDRAPVELQGMSLHVVQIVLLESADRNALKLAVRQPPETRLFGAAKSPGQFDQSLEHCLQIECRSADKLEHVGGRRLLLMRLFQFAGEVCDLCFLADSRGTAAAHGL